MREKVTKRLETSMAELVMIILLIVILLSSCGTSYCVQNEWANPLSKQYSRTCN